MSEFCTRGTMEPILTMISIISGGSSLSLSFVDAVAVLIGNRARLTDFESVLRSGTVPMMMHGTTSDSELDIEKRVRRRSERANSTKKCRNRSCLQPIQRETA